MRVSEAAGTSVASVVAFIVLVVWAVTGPLFGFSDTWQLLINTGTTIVTFLMVFLIQHSENKNSRALHLKLDELIAASHQASNELIDLEKSTDEDMDEIHTSAVEVGTGSRRIELSAITSVGLGRWPREGLGDSSVQRVGCVPGDHRRDVVAASICPERRER